MHSNRIRHRNLRVSSKDKTSGTTSQASYRLGSVAFPTAQTISLESAAIPQMVPNVYSANNKFIYYISQTINTTAGTNDEIKIQDQITNIVYTVNVGNINGSPATFNADLTAIQNQINLVLPNTVVLIAVEPSPYPNSQPKLQLSIGANDNPIKILSTSTMGLVLGVYTKDSDNITDATPVILPNPYGGELIIIPSFQYNITELLDKLEELLNNDLALGSVVIERNSTLNPTESYDQRVVITYTPGGGETFYVGAEPDGSPMSEVLGYTGIYSTSIPKAQALFQLFGIQELYIHCKQTNQQKTQLSDNGKLVSIHATIPITVGFGQLLTFTAPHHDFFRVRIQRNSNQMKFFTITLRDAKGNILHELDPYNYSMVFDIDIIEK